MAISYVRTQGGVTIHLTTNERDPNINTLFMKEASHNPFLAIMTKMNKVRRVGDFVYRWQQDDNVPRKLTINGAIADTTSTLLTVDTPQGGYVKPNDVIVNLTTGEQMLVTAANSATTFTVKRGWTNETTAALGIATNIGDNDVLLNIGCAVPHGSSSVAQITSVPDEITNYLGTFRTSYDITEEKAAQKTLGAGMRKGQYLKEVQYKALMQHRIKVEAALLMGRPQVDVTTDADGKPIYLAGGLDWAIRDGGGTYYNPAGALTEANFIASVIEPITDRNPGARLVCFAGPKVIRAINGFAGGTGGYVERQFKSDSAGQKKLGLNVETYQYGPCLIDIIPHPLLSVNDGTDGRAFVLNMDDISRIGHMSLPDFEHRTDEQDNDELAIKGSYVSRMGLEHGNVQNSAVIAGVTS